MTPGLMQDGAQRMAHAHHRRSSATVSGDRRPGIGRLHVPGEIDVTHGRILYLEDVHVSFDGFKAINGLSLDIAPGELRCIIGPNGAGKTTMMDIITGKTRPDRGRVFLGSTIDLLRYREADIATMGIGRKFQKPTVFEAQSVFTNLELSLKTNKGVLPTLFARLGASQRARIADVFVFALTRLACNFFSKQEETYVNFVCSGYSRVFLVCVLRLLGNFHSNDPCSE